MALPREGLSILFSEASSTETRQELKRPSERKGSSKQATRLLPLVRCEEYCGALSWALWLRAIARWPGQVPKTWAEGLVSGAGKTCPRGFLLAGHSRDLYPLSSPSQFALGIKHHSKSLLSDFTPLDYPTRGFWLAVLLCFYYDLALFLSSAVDSTVDCFVTIVCGLSDTLFNVLRTHPRECCYWAA